MKRTLKIISVAVTMLLLPVCGFCQESYTGTIDYARKTNKLWGISACIINKDNSVTFVDSKDKGYGYALWMPDTNGAPLDSMTLNPGQSLKLTDGHHVFINYKFIGVKDGRIIVEVTDKFDARSFGNGVREERKKLTVAPYDDNSGQVDSKPN
ncbi:MAG: hypothetical protein PHP17_07265 [Candidatus Omnitrophica bacterium]|nr:hypothetical protein [Candidatus Omnitrophota bacterium]